MTCLSCGAREPDAGPGRHSSEEGTGYGTTSLDASMSRMCVNGGTATDDEQDGDVFRLRPVSTVHIPLSMESHASPSEPSCSAAQPSEAQMMVVESDSGGSEESYIMWNVPAASPPEQKLLLQQL